MGARRAVVVVGVLAVACAGGGRGAPSVEIYAAAADQLAAQTSARFEMTVTMRFSGEGIPSGALSVTSTSTGEWAADGPRAHAETRVQGPGVDQTFDAFVVGTTVYLPSEAVPVLDERPTTPWVSYDVTRLGYDPEQAAAGPMSLEQWIDWIRSAGGEVTTVGEEEVRGITTTRYAAAVPGDVVLEQGAQQAVGAPIPRQELERVAAEMEVTGPAELELWVDEEGLPRRVAIRYALTFQEATADVDARLEIIAYGVPVEVTPPPAEQVTDVTDLLLEVVA